MSSRSPPFTLGPYRVLKEIGSGGSATVYEAVFDDDSGFCRPTALKLFRGDTADEDPNVARMLAEEARLLGRMQHPNIVSVSWFGALPEPGGGVAWAMAMELVRGVSFRALLNEAKARPESLPLTRAVELFADLARGLAHAHGQHDASGSSLGFVHGDLKPANVMLSDDGVVKLLDFGLARATERLIDPTGANAIRGTVQYMSPEQVRSADLDFRSDLFSLGAMLWEAATRHRLIRAQILTAAMHEVATFDLQARLDGTPDLPIVLVPILRRLLANRTDARYASTEALVVELDALHHCLRGEAAVS